jgi:hypothetical protein
VEHAVHARDRAAHGRGVAQVALDDLHVGETGEVLPPPGREVVQHADAIAAPDEASAMFEPMKPAPPVTR